VNKNNYYFNQMVVKEDLNGMQDHAEAADKNIVRDILGAGIISGLTVSPNNPADLQVKYAIGIAYDSYGNRIEVLNEGLSNCSSYAIQSADNERWLSIVARFARNSYNEQQDGEGITVLYNNDEYFQISVLPGAIASIGNATKPAPAVGDVILADVRLYYGQINIVVNDISTTRTISFRTPQNVMLTHNSAQTLDHPDNSVIDAKIGNRTITDTNVPITDTNSLTILLGNLGNTLKTITGKSNWKTAPDVTLQTIYNTFNNKSHASNGYQKLQGGLIIQWGKGSPDLDNYVDVVLPLSFPNNHFMAVGTLDILHTGSERPDCAAYPNGVNKVRLGKGNVNGNIQFICIGN
jgi:hypothetical protein